MFIRQIFAKAIRRPRCAAIISQLCANQLRQQRHISRLPNINLTVLQYQKSSAQDKASLYQKRAFASLQDAEQVTKQNPRLNESGQEMKIEITPRAAKRLADIMVKDKNDNLALRVSVESGGCHGFQYLMSLTDKVEEDDTVFELNGSKVVMDEPSLELLNGSKLDYTMELIGSQFKIVDNPYATSSCGIQTNSSVAVGISLTFA